MKYNYTNNYNNNIESRNNFYKQDSLKINDVINL